MAFHAISSSLLDKERKKKNSEDRISLYLEYSHSCEEPVCALKLFSHFEGEKKMSDKKQLLLLAWGIWPRDESSFISMWLAVWWVSESFGLSWHRCWDQSWQNSPVSFFFALQIFFTTISDSYGNHLIFNLGLTNSVIETSVKIHLYHACLGQCCWSSTWGRSKIMNK